MTFNSTDRAFIDGDIIVKVENIKEAKYIVGISLIADKGVEFSDPYDYEYYPYFVIEEDELIAYSKVPNSGCLTLVDFKDFVHNDTEDPIKKTDRESLVADSTCQ